MLLSYNISIFYKNINMFEENRKQNLWSMWYNNPIIANVVGMELGKLSTYSLCTHTKCGLWKEAYTRELTVVEKVSPWCEWWSIDVQW